MTYLLEFELIKWEISIKKTTIYEKTISKNQ